MLHCVLNSFTQFLIWTWMIPVIEGLNKKGLQIFSFRDVFVDLQGLHFWNPASVYQKISSRFKSYCSLLSYVPFFVYISCAFWYNGFVDVFTCLRNIIRSSFVKKKVKWILKITTKLADSVLFRNSGLKKYHLHLTVIYCIVNV